MSEAQRCYDSAARSSVAAHRDNYYETKFVAEFCIESANILELSVTTYRSKAMSMKCIIHLFEINVGWRRIIPVSLRILIDALKFVGLIVVYPFIFTHRYLTGNQNAVSIQCAFQTRQIYAGLSVQDFLDNSCDVFSLRQRVLLEGLGVGHRDVHASHADGRGIKIVKSRSYFRCTLC